MSKLLVLGAALLLAPGFTHGIGLSLSTLNNPFFVSVRDGAQAAAQDLGLSLAVTDAQDSVSIQISDIEDLIQRGVDVLIVNATDSDAVVPAVREANAKGIPVIAVDRGINGGNLAYLIASDNMAGGALAGEFICRRLRGHGYLVELEGIPGTSATRQRGQGFNDYLRKECTGLQVVARQTANFNRAEGLSVMENILVAQPEIDAVFAHNDEMALGALQAVKGSGRAIQVIGFDATEDARKAVQICTMTATIAQQPRELGRQAIQAAKAILDNGAPASTQNIAVRPLLVSNPSCL